MTGRLKVEIVLSAEERTRLEQWVRGRTAQQQLALRAKIILLLAKGHLNKDVAEELRIQPRTVGKWRSRFLAFRYAGLFDNPRPGKPRTMDDRRVEAVIRKTLDSKPKQATQWSTRSMAEACKVSQSSVSRIWRAFGLKPHRQKKFKLSEDPQFLEKTRDVVGLYLNPPERALVLCVDEKSQIQALDRTQPLLPMAYGKSECVTHDYVRHGTTSLFAALDVATGKVIGKCQRRHRHQEFLAFLRHVDANVAHEKGQSIHLIMDNYNTHKSPAVKAWFLAHPEYEVHFTPTSSSWLNLVERFFSEITNKRIRRGVFRNVPALEAAIRDYLAHHNQNPKPFIWVATVGQIFDKIEKLCARINDSGH
jgi:transposase